MYYLTIAFLQLSKYALAIEGETSRLIIVSGTRLMPLYGNLSRIFLGASRLTKLTT